jgi:hypothetical protein
MPPNIVKTRKERKKDILITRAQEAYDILRQVWPKPTGKMPYLPSNESCRIANEYYVRSAPTIRTEILFLGESHCETASSILGEKNGNRPFGRRTEKRNHQYLGKKWK